MADRPESKGNTTAESTPPDTGRQDATPPNTEDDFAAEHSDVTLADEMSGGPEGQPEDDSPSGLAGAD